MKRYLVALAVLAAPYAYSQEATLNTPVVRASEAKFRVDSLNFTRNPVQAAIVVEVQDSSNNDLRAINIPVPGTALCTTTFAGLMTAMANAAANETGTDTRRMQFRILTYLNTQACLGTITLVP